jgi:hypothetical protein
VCFAPNVFRSTIRVHSHCGACRATNLHVVDPGSTPGRRIRFTTAEPRFWASVACFPRLTFVLHCEKERLDVCSFILKLRSLKGLERTV